MGSLTPPPTTALAPGDRLERYELLCELAQGGMGTVWLARATGKHGFERMVALKTILPTYEADRQFFDMFLDEARIAAQVSHENVAHTIDVGEDRGVLFHAMELVDGESLRKLYKDIRAHDEPFPLGIALRVCADLCAGLHAVHELLAADGRSLEVVHRDVSPQNVLLTSRGTVKLIDFGVAKARERRTEETTAGTIKGKLEYMSPEQAGGDPVDRRADVYSVGAMLYELLCGETVRIVEDGRQLLALHELVSGDPYEPLPASIPQLVRSLVDKAIAHDPKTRYASADELRRALEQAMVAVGCTATHDDVQATLQAYSRERLAARQAFIDAAIRAPNPRALPSPPSGPPGPGQTKVMSVTPRATSSPPSARPSAPPILARTPSVAPILARTPSLAPLPKDDPTSGPSIQALGGAAMSHAPPATSTGARAFGVMIVLALVAVLGVVVGVVMVAPTAAPAGAPSAVLTEAPSSAPSAAPKAPPPVTVASASPTAITAPTTTFVVGTIIGASDGGGPAPSAKPATRPRPTTKPKDEYGF